MHARPRSLVREVLAGFREHDLLTYASAISFQCVVALSPLVLTVLGVLGVLGADEVWSRDVAPDLRRSVSPDVFSVLDDTARRVLADGRVVWLTLGAALTLWYVSSAIRAAMGALDGVYGCRVDRRLADRLRTSLLLAPPLVLCVVGAAAVVRLGPLVLDVPGAVSFVICWAVAVTLLGLGLGLLVHHAPATPQPLGWVSFGAALSIALWVAMSLGFTLYLTQFADYGSLYGNLASLVVLYSYLYLSSSALLLGVQLDAVLRERATGEAHGESAAPSEPRYARASA